MLINNPALPAESLKGVCQNLNFDTSPLRFVRIDQTQDIEDEVVIVNVSVFPGGRAGRPCRM